MCDSEADDAFNTFKTICPRPLNCTDELQRDGYVPLVQDVGPSIVALVSCSISIFSSLLILYTYVRWKDVRTGSRSIITFLAIADLVTASGYVIGSANYIYEYRNWKDRNPYDPCNTFNTVCEIQSFLTTTSSMSSFAWTSILAVYLYLIIVKAKIRTAYRLMPLFHIIAWLLPLVITLPLLIKDRLGYAPFAASNWCFISARSVRNKDLCGNLNYELFLLVLVGGKLWEIITYVLIIILYMTIKLHIYKETRKAGSYQFIDPSMVSAMQRADKKLTFIPIVFVLLRIWGTTQFLFISGLAKVTCYDCIPKTYEVGITFLAYAQALGDGGQGWGNVLLYIFSSPKIRLRLWRCVRHPSLRYVLKLGPSESDAEDHNEIINERRGPRVTMADAEKPTGREGRSEDTTLYSTSILEPSEGEKIQYELSTQIDKF